jgi:hypothetical protein
MDECQKMGTLLGKPNTTQDQPSKVTKLLRRSSRIVERERLSAVIAVILIIIHEIETLHPARCYCKRFELPSFPVCIVEMQRSILHPRIPNELHRFHSASHSSCYSSTMLFHSCTSGLYSTQSS